MSMMEPPLNCSTVQAVERPPVAGKLAQTQIIDSAAEFVLNQARANQMVNVDMIKGNERLS